MEAAVKERPEGGRLLEDSAVDLASSWEDTPVRKGKLIISVRPLFCFRLLLVFPICPNLGKSMNAKFLLLAS
jgi:hypothetical protein